MNPARNVQAHEAIEPDDLMRLLQDVIDEHPDLWQSWSVTIQQLTLAGLVTAGMHIDPESGDATLKAALAADGTDTSDPFAELEGEVFGVNFNPVALTSSWSSCAASIFFRRWLITTSTMLVPGSK